MILKTEMKKRGVKTANVPPRTLLIYSIKPIVMKKIIIALLLVISLISFQQAGAQQLKYYYYPSSNVYYDVANHHYIYLNNGTWTTVTSLPLGIRASGRRVLLRHSGDNIWVNNQIHKQ